MDEDCERVRNHAIALSNFLWLISIDKIPEIKFVVPSENDDLLNYLSERKRKCLALLSSTENTIDSNDSNFRNQGDVLKQLTATIANQLESSKETNRISRLEYERKIDKDNNKTDTMGELHGSVRHMFLNAASENGEDAAEDLPDSCKSFFNQDSAALS